MRRYVFCLFFLAALVLVLCIGSGSVWAGPQVFDPIVSDCTGINCSSITLGGSYVRDQVGNANPFILQVFADANRCLRVAVAAQTADSEMVLISPSGRVWQNDDRSNSDKRPLIEAITDVRGWYTLQVSRFDGGGSFLDFFLNYGVYKPSNNPNCSDPTTPSVSRADSEKPLDGGVSGHVLQEGPSAP